MAEFKIRKMPIGIQNFEKLRNDGYLYVDKTSLMYQLISEGSYYFLSRPRRFGKSLMISTLKAFFEGKKELFEGLAVAQNPEVTWEEHPIFHLDLNTNKYDRPAALENVLNENLVAWEELYGKNPAEIDFGRRFMGVIRRACEKTGQRVVILVDEYDKPMLQAIGNKELQTEYRAILKGFYGALKSMDGYIKFAFLTGVTKFGQVSVFSDLNHLNDISMDARYYDICGITEQELLSNFQPDIEALASANKITYQECVDKLRERYDGYHFEETTPGMYNPYSVLLTLSKQKFGSYWFETGTPSYLVYLLQKHDYNLEQMSHDNADADLLNSTDSESVNPIPVIYQSGYLTIKGYSKEFETYTLGFPNKEVEEALAQIQDKNYTLPFQLEDQKVIRIGINFDKQTRNIDNFAVEEVSTEKNW